MAESIVSRKHKDPPRSSAQKPVSLKQLAEHLGLNPATVSVVLNDVPGRSIPQATRDRIKAAAKQMKDKMEKVFHDMRVLAPPRPGDNEEEKPQ